MGDSGGGLHHGLHHWSLDHWAGNSKRSWESWSSEGGWSNWGWDSSDNWRGEEGSRHDRGSNRDGLSDGINETILVDVLGESLQRKWSQTTLSGDQVSESSSERSSNLGVGLGFSLVETMDGLVAGSGERASIAGGVVRSVEVRVAIRGIVVQRISFRFCQAERGDNENSDLKFKY